MEQVYWQAKDCVGGNYVKAELKKNSLNQVIQGTEIFSEGEPVTDIGLLVKGRVRVCAEGVNIVIGTGNFIGLCDLVERVHNVTYIAETDLAVYTFQASGLVGTVGALTQSKKEYAPLIVTTLSKYIRDLAKTYGELKKGSKELHAAINEAYQRYQTLGKELGTRISKMASVENMDGYLEVVIPGESLIDYYRTIASLPSALQKAFFSASTLITLRHIKEQASLVSNLIMGCEEYAGQLREMACPLILDDRSLYTNVLQQAMTLQRAGEKIDQVSVLFDDIIANVNRIDNLMTEIGGIDLGIDHKFMEESYYNLINGGAAGTSDSEDENEVVDLSVLDGSLDIILEHSGLSAEEEQSFREYINAFIDLPDKFSTDDEVRTLRRNIIKIYYTIYKNIFMWDHRHGGNSPKPVDLFLRYGFLSEKLISEQMAKELLSIQRSSGPVGECAVYDIKEWLTLIYEGGKEPSKSEFDEDYSEHLREMIKTNQITKDEQKKLENDMDAKFDYELQNMFKLNHRLLFIQPSAFVPFLFTDACVNSLSSSILSAEKLNLTVQKLRQIDFSVFYRERIYGKGEFAKEYIEEEVYPDIILMPCYGNKGQMWQEISGRRKNTPARFLLPVFMESDLDSEMVKLMGRFRWELCRTMQGAAWNNIQVKSLTSEYSDFLQFYRKNRDLSNDKKEKLKMQIQKCRNNTRDVFVMDYEKWIKHESKGGLLLSKPVREIMAMYCPFRKDIREKVLEQPMFQMAMARYMREKAKKIKEYDLKFRVWEKDGVEIPPEVAETKRFYTEM